MLLGVPGHVGGSLRNFVFSSIRVSEGIYITVGDETFDLRWLTDRLGVLIGCPQSFNIGGCVEEIRQDINAGRCCYPVWARTPRVNDIYMYPAEKVPRLCSFFPHISSTIPLFLFAQDFFIYNAAILAGIFTE